MTRTKNQERRKKHNNNNSKNDFINLVRQYEYDKALIACHRYPSQVRHYRDSDGRTALHVVAMALNDGPLISAALIEAIIKAYPRAASVQDTHGFTPLHCAISAGIVSNERILSLLLQAHPKAVQTTTNDGYTPLHLTRTVTNALFLLQHYPQGLFVKDNYGNTPLTYICNFCCRYINDKTDSLVGLSNRIVNFHQSQRRSLRQLLQQQRQGDESSATSSRCPCYIPPLSPLQNQRPFDTVRVAWDVLCVLVQHYNIMSVQQHTRHRMEKRSGDSHSDNGRFISSLSSSRIPTLHSILACDVSTLQLCSVAIQLYPHQTQQVDKDGNYPLHLAAKLVKKWWEIIRKEEEEENKSIASTCCYNTPKSPSSSLHQRFTCSATASSNTKPLRDDDTAASRKHHLLLLLLERIIHVLVNRYPTAAHKRNGDDEFPLNIILASRPSSSSSFSSFACQVSVRKILVLLIEANPTAVHTLQLCHDMSLLPNLLSTVGKDCNLHTMLEIVKGIPYIFAYGGKEPESFEEEEKEGQGGVIFPREKSEQDAATELTR